MEYFDVSGEQSHISFKHIAIVSIWNICRRTQKVRMYSNMKYNNITRIVHYSWLIEPIRFETDEKGSAAVELLVKFLYRLYRPIGPMEKMVAGIHRNGSDLDIKNDGVRKV